MQSKFVTGPRSAFRFAILIGLLATQAIAAAPSYASVNVSPSSGPPGTTVTVNASGFAPGSNAEIRWDGATLDSFTMPGSGSFSRSIAVPGGAGAGGHTISVCNYCGGGEFEENASAGFNVTSPATPKPTEPPTPTLPPPTPTPIPVCTDLGLGPEGLVIDFDTDTGARGDFAGLKAFDAGAIHIFMEVEIVSPSVAVRSGSQAAQSQQGLEFGSALRPIRILFTDPVQAVGMFVGLEAAPEARGLITATLTAYGYRAGAGPVVVLGTDRVSFPAAPTDLRHCLAVEAAPVDVLTWAFVEYTDSSGTSIAEPRLIDDMTIVPSDVPFPPDLPPVVEITEPEDGVRVIGDEVILRATIRDDRALVVAWAGVNDRGLSVGTSPSAVDPTLYTVAVNIPVSRLRPFLPNIANVGARDTSGQRGDDTITLIYEPPFDAQVMGIEVTQGMRGAIPWRDPPDAPTSLGAETTVHVADRKTVVRVYPWIDFDFTTDTSLPLTAQLFGFRDGVPLPGSPLHPLNSIVLPSPGWTLEEMRANEGMSWNFVLPREWVRQGSVSLQAEINPQGDGHLEECADCAENNAASLDNVNFRVLQSRDVEVRIYVADTYWRDATGEIEHVAPTLSEIADALRWWLSTWPMATYGGSDSGVMQTYLLGSRIAAQDGGPVEPPIPGAPQWDNQVYMDENSDLISPSRATDAYAYIPLLFSPSSFIGCSGRAGIGFPPLFHAGACGVTVAQEAAHTIGRNHACPVAPCEHGEEFGGPLDPGYPGAHGQVEAHAFGFDVFAVRAIPPEGDGGLVHDFMSYADNFWVSLYTWDAITEIFLAENGSGSTTPSLFMAAYHPGASLVASSAPAAGPLSTYLRLSGTIDATGAVLLNPSFLVAAQQAAGNALGSGPYRIALLDGDGEAVYSLNFETLVQTHAPADAPAEFYELVPLLDGVRQIAFLQGETEMARFALSRRAPTVEIVEPAPGASWAAEGMATVVWEASDPDRNDALVYRVEASPDGSRWHVLASGLTETQATIDLSTIPGGGEGWSLRVQASDGFNVGADVVSPLTIAPSLPQALILEPADRSFFGVGRTVSALGRGVDWADGVLPDAALTWEIDGRPAGEGTALEFDGLDAGEHTLTLRTTNAAGLTQTMEIRITVGVDTDGDGMPDEWELRQGLDYENPGDAARDVDGDTLRNWQEFNYGTNPTDADTDGDGLDDAAEIASGSDPLDPTSTAFDGHHGDTHTPYPTPRQVPVVEGAGGAGPSSLVIAAGVLVAVAIVGTGVLLLARRRRRASKVS